MNFAIIGIGSNIEREKNFKVAKSALKKSFPKIVFSRTVETRPVGFRSKKMFFNAAAKFLSPMENTFPGLRISYHLAKQLYFSVLPQYL